MPLLDYLQRRATPTVSPATSWMVSASAKASKGVTKAKPLDMRRSRRACAAAWCDSLGSGMNFKQRSGWVSTEFDLGEEVIHHTYRTLNMTRSRAISYASLELEERSTLVSQNRFALLLGFSLLLSGVVFFALGMSESLSLAMCWLGAIASFIGAWRTRYVLVEVDRADPVHIIADSNFDPIMEELSRRRKELWHRLYADYDPLADPRDELRKFEWLLERKVISLEDFEWVRSEIEMSQRGLEPEELN